METIQSLAMAFFILCAEIVARAQSWTPTTAPPTNWTSIAMSADGTKAAAASLYGIWISTNSGSTWIQTSAPSAPWVSIASSAGGSQLVAAASRATAGPLIVSTNSGLTWATNIVGGQVWSSVASSADGKILVAAVNNGAIFVSTNFGASWTAWAETNSITHTPVYRPWISAAASADGTKLIAAFSAYSGGLYSSVNSGSVWMPMSFPAGGCDSVASSANGNTLVAACESGIFTSTNSGQTWSSFPVPNITLSYHAAASADGTKLIALIYDGRVYSSTNSGGTWTSNAVIATTWGPVASSSDGNLLFAANRNGNNSLIWSFQTISSPMMNVTSSNSDLVLSWLVPSTNFHLQQNSDLTMTNWPVVTNAPALNLTNLQNQVTLPLPAGDSFYRLKTP
jgi:hypothetical protein